MSHWRKIRQKYQFYLQLGYVKNELIILFFLLQKIDLNKNFSVFDFTVFYRLLLICKSYTYKICVIDNSDSV